jgi:hypothetical protein
MIMMSSSLQNPIEKREEPRNHKELKRNTHKNRRVRPKQGEKKF